MGKVTNHTYSYLRNNNVTNFHQVDFIQAKTLFLTMFLKFSVVIDGWEPIKNLRIDEYINPKKSITLTTGSKVCPKTDIPFAVVLVSSTKQNKQARKAIRETWAEKSFEKYGISVAFVLGVSEHGKVDVSANNFYSY